MTEKVLHVVEGHPWPIRAVTEKFAWLGRTSSGKTYGLKRFVEQMLYAGVQVVILDSVGVWRGLRLGTKGFDVPVIGGLYGDIPLEPASGALVAEVAVSSGSSLVLDTSQMIDAQRARFCEHFGRRLFELKKSAPAAMHIVLDEGQDVVPQNANEGEKMMLHEWVRIAKQGRAFGIGLSISSQRPQEVNKKALNQAECVMAFQLTGAHERKALEYWLADKGIETRLSNQLPLLEVGKPFVWSPQWLKVASVLGQILPIDSADTSKTPEVGDAPREHGSMRPIDLSALQASMVSMVEESKQNDTKALRDEIKRLQKLVADGGVAINRAAASELVARANQIKVQRKHMISNVASQLGEVLRLSDVILGTLRSETESVEHENLTDDLEDFFKDLRAAPTVAKSSKPTPIPESIQPKPTETLAAKAERVRESTKRAPVRKEPDGSTGLPPGEEQCLRVISSRGEQGASTALIVLHTGYRASSIRTYTHRLVTRVLARRQQNLFYTTGAGDELCPAGKLPTGKKLLDHYEETLPPGEAFVINALRITKKPMSTANLAAEGKYTESSLRTYTHRLITRGIIKRKSNCFSLVEDAK